MNRERKGKRRGKEGEKKGKRSEREPDIIKSLMGTGMDD